MHSASKLWWTCYTSALCSYARDSTTAQLSNRRHAVFGPKTYNIPVINDTFRTKVQSSMCGAADKFRRTMSRYREMVAVKIVRKSLRAIFFSGGDVVIVQFRSMIHAHVRWQQQLDLKHSAFCHGIWARNMTKQIIYRPNQRDSANRNTVVKNYVDHLVHTAATVVSEFSLLTADFKSISMQHRLQCARKGRRGHLQAYI